MTLLKDIFAVIVFATGMVLALCAGSIWVTAMDSVWGVIPGVLSSVFIVQGALSWVERMIRHA